MRRVQKVIIQGRMPSLNDVIDLIFKDPINSASGFSKVNYAKELYRKRKAELEKKVVTWTWISNAVPVEEKCNFVIVWYEKDLKRDADNVYSGAKFIMDGLRKSPLLGGDSQKYIGDISNKIALDRKNPRIEIFILEGIEIELPLDLLERNVKNIPKQTKYS